MRALKKAANARTEAKMANWDRAIEKGRVLKKKLGSKKWESRYAVLTSTHLLWFEDEEAFKSRKVKGQINLYDVDRVLIADCPPDDKPTNPLQKLKPKIMHVIMKGGDPDHPLVYLFSEDWKRGMDAMLGTLPSITELEKTSPALAKRASFIVQTEGRGLGASRSAPNLRKASSSPKLDEASAIDYNKCMKAGYVEKRKFEEGSKWERRYMLLTAGHLVWFKDKEARDKMQPQNLIPLKSVREVNISPIPGDDTVPVAIYIVLADVTYLFYDCAKSKHLQEQWRNQVAFATKLVNPGFIDQVATTE